MNSRRLPLTTALVLALALGGCGDDAAVPFRPDPQPVPTADPGARVLALGDSYTEGRSVRIDLSWPFQLADSLAAGGDTLQDNTQIALTGWTTGDLIAAVERARLAPPYDLVTLMIGVNNQYRGQELAVFEREFPQLVHTAVALAGDDPRRVLTFSVPDYGVTPVGGFFDGRTIAREIDLYNTTGRAIADSLGVAWLDITPLSRTAADDPALVARDGLHFSAAMYARWVAFMLPQVRGVLTLGWD
jgi:lysophospholipase L1-like esterase